MKFAALVMTALIMLAAPALAAKDAVVPLAPAPPAVSEPAPIAQPTVPDTSNIMFIQNLRKIGATVYYLGQDLGLNGWFVVKDGQVQIIYTTPDQKAVMIGALLSAEGANISQQQVMLLANSNPEIQKIIKGSAAVTAQGPKPAPTTSAPQAAPVNTTPNAPAVSDEAVQPSQKFFDALKKTANVTFGKDTAPELLMIMDVNCPHCHRAWSAMQPLVDGGKLRVTMIPIAALGAQSQSEAANWLTKKDPYVAWKKHVAGDDKIFKVGVQEPEKENAVFENTKLVQKWGVDQTPYILYYGKNGKVRLIIGEPKSIDDIMLDIK